MSGPSMQPSSLALPRPVAWMILGAALALAAEAQVESAHVEEAPPEGAGMALVEEPGSDTNLAGPDETSAEQVASPQPAEPTPISRITFDVPFAAEKGGGSARGTAGAMEYLGEDQIVASGAVELSYQNVRIQAERITVDLVNKEVLAEGNVIMDEGPGRLSGSRMVYDLDQRVGKIYDAEAFVDPDVFLTGREITKESDTVFSIDKGTITSCSEDRVPDWSFRLGRARVNTEGFARVKNTTFRLKKMPLLYAPYMLFPAKRGRVPGFLFPNFGHSRSRGAYLGLAWFQPMGESYDATIFADLYGKDFFGLGTEFRYRPSHHTQGDFRGFVIEDPGDEDDPLAESRTRWKATYTHSSNSLPLGFRGVVRYRGFSDFEFFRDFERSFNNVVLRTLWSSAFLAGSWGSHSLNLLVDERETFLGPTSTVVQRQLPEIEYRLRPTKLGKAPLYFELLSSLNLFEVDRTSQLSGSYGRADFNPTLTLPVSPAPWLSFSLAASGRATFYDDSLTADRDAFSGESLERVFPSANARIIGPSFSRIFDRKIGRFGKFKHVIEPRWAYVFVDDFEDQRLVPLFDEIDTVRDQELAAFSLVHRFLAKPADEESGEGAREIMSFELGQVYSLRDDEPLQTSRDGTLEKKEGPLSAKFRFNPSYSTSFETRASYNTLFNKLESASLLGSTRFGQHALSLSWLVRQDPELERTTSHQARLATGFQLIRNRLRLDSRVNFDLEDGFLQSQRHVVTYTSQCFGILFEWRELSRLIGGRESSESDFRMSLSLKNIGTFLDLNSGGGDSFR